MYFIVVPYAQRLKKRGKRMCKIVHVAIHIVNECIKRDIEIDYFKVQKLAYCSQGWHLKKYDVPLAPEAALNWSCGAGFKEIYAFFKTNNLIDEKKLTNPINKKLDLLSFEKETIDCVIDKYADLPFNELKSLYTYEQIAIGEVIPNDIIKDSFNNNL